MKNQAAWKHNHYWQFVSSSKFLLNLCHQLCQPPLWLSCATGLLGFFATKAAGFNERTCRTVAIETAMKLSKGWFEGLNGVKCHCSMFGNGWYGGVPRPWCNPCLFEPSRQSVYESMESVDVENSLLSCFMDVSLTTRKYQRSMTRRITFWNFHITIVKITIFQQLKLRKSSAFGFLLASLHFGVCSSVGPNGAAWQVVPWPVLVSSNPDI